MQASWRCCAGRELRTGSCDPAGGEYLAEGTGVPIAQAHAGPRAWLPWLLAEPCRSAGEGFPPPAPQGIGSLLGGLHSCWQQRVPEPSPPNLKVRNIRLGPVSDVSGFFISVLNNYHPQVKLVYFCASVAPLAPQRSRGEGGRASSLPWPAPALRPHGSVPCPLLETSAPCSPSCL